MYNFYFYSYSSDQIPNESKKQLLREVADSYHQ